MIDLSPFSDRELELQYAFNALKVPANKCEPIKSRFTSQADQLKRSATLANCIIDSWRPFVESRGITLPKAEVLPCSKAKEGKSCRDEESAMADGHRIYLGKLLGLGDLRDEGDVTMVILHEAAHVLQATLSYDEDTPVLVRLSTDYRDEKRESRRVELQAQCLAVAMFSSKTPLNAQSLEKYIFQSDDTHYDEKTGRFWMRQGLKNQVGECNAIIAANSLLGYEL